MMRPLSWMSVVLLCFSAAGALALIVVPSLPLNAAKADDNASQQAAPAKGAPQPNVSITPRPKIGPTTPESVTDRRSDIRVDTNLVLIYVSVTDPIGRYVTGLDRDNFKLTEEFNGKKIEQELTQFSSEDAPMSVGIVFDTSGSMGPKLQRSRQAVKQFLQAANPEDEFFLISFNDRPELVVSFTPDTEEIQNRTTFFDSKGRTALLDAVYMAMNQMKKARNPRKAVLIISDGGDNSSRYTESEVKAAVRESDVQIYSIGIFESMAGRNRTPEEASGPQLLNEVSESTGGRFFSADSLADLPDIAAKIGLELRNQYVLGYSPKNKERDGKFRRVQVRLVKTAGMPQLKATHRPGYYAPAQ
ncbi:MAG TPA: VWA domain-containing protein [Bryobacteraceae bacterium]